MDYTISVSEEAEEVIKDKAGINRQKPEDFLREFVESSFGGRGPNGNDNSEQRRRHHNLAKFAGMFSSGYTDTAARMSEIMRETDFDPAEGFSSGLNKK